MKKIVFIIICLFIIVFINNSSQQLVIPGDAIRFRIIANSNSIVDQSNKMIIKNVLEKEVINDLKDAVKKDDFANVINSNIGKYKNTISDALNYNNIDSSFNINYGYNYFPKKEYKGVKYNDGYYESLVVTLGNGLGDNWWCVLFPPLCLLEAEESDNANDVEYRFFIKDIIDKYF